MSSAQSREKVKSIVQTPKAISIWIKILLTTVTEVLGRAKIRTTKPPNWPNPIDELDEKDPRNNGFLNEDFIVWMRAAAFPTFKKLYGRLNQTHHFKEGLPAERLSNTGPRDLLKDCEEKHAI
ncbi:hypothetical protein P7K49_031129 [Saguinus oedipus]|uniref:Cell cycle control protein 50C n=1 Tax=Saguinus oedipus TaxID=9490 RepID=A0ABQ9U4Y3_SAGOE|nr:hypothetical protein P7K49_031129 [Saguinus oedipus]